MCSRAPGTNPLWILRRDHTRMLQNVRGKVKLKDTFIFGAKILKSTHSFPIIHISHMFHVLAEWNICPSKGILCQFYRPVFLRRNALECWMSESKPCASQLRQAQGGRALICLQSLSLVWWLVSGRTQASMEFCRVVAISANNGSMFLAKYHAELLAVAAWSTLL